MNPTTVRVSDTLMLSDCVGCDSVYRYGYANPISWQKSSSYYTEIKKLGALCDKLHEEYGPYSVAYGYISPALSQKVVKYQNPDKPSYHRWDAGAAMDLNFHDWKGPPVKLAHEIDEYYDYSRMITYSESEWICLGTRAEEGKARKALYENRYVGERKPLFVKYSENPDRRASQKAAHELSHPWEGQGYPSYHGGGREQFHHVRVGDYTMLSDLLYDAKLVHKGIKNMPPRESSDQCDEFWNTAYAHGDLISQLVSAFAHRFSVVKGYNRDKWPYTEIIPVHGIAGDDVADFISGRNIRAEVRKTVSGIERVRFYV